MLRSLLELARIALLPTIVWDVFAGLWIAGYGLESRGVAAMLSGLCVYHAGMIFNDLADRRIDAEFRPQRPIPSGRVAPWLAAVLGTVLMAGALLISWTLLGFGSLYLMSGLCAVVLIYDFGGTTLRETLGPILLAVARLMSLHLGVVAIGGTDAFFGEAIVQPALAYTLWFMFTSRLATREEEGTAGMRGLQYVIGTAMAPILIVLDGGPWWFYPAWFALAAWLIWPAARDRNMFWAPERVQAAVRNSLSTAPIVLGLALLKSDFAWLGLLAPLVTVLVSYLARSMAPE